MDEIKNCEACSHADHAGAKCAEADCVCGAPAETVEQPAQTEQQ